MVRERVVEERRASACARRRAAPAARASARERGSARRRSMPSTRLVRARRTGALFSDPVRQRREAAAPLGQRAARCPSTRACERRAVPLPVVGEELALEPRHVHADRALGLARAALEAQIERLVDALVAEARPRRAGRPSPAAARWRGRASSAAPRASPCTTGTSCPRASCGTRRGRCTSRPRRPCRRSPSSRNRSSGCGVT